MQPPPDQQTQDSLNTLQIISGTLNTTVRNLWLFLLVVVGSVGILWLYAFIRNLLRDFLHQMIAQHEVPARFQESLDLSHAIIPWLLVLPLMIAFYSAGSRVLAMHDNNAPLFSVMKEMFIGIRYATLGTLYAFKVIPYFIVPGLAVIILNPIIHQYLTTTPLLIAYYVAMIVIFGWTIHLIIPVLVVPIIGVCSRMLPHEAIHDGYALHNLYGWQLFFLAVIEIAYAFIVYSLGIQLNLELIYTFALQLIGLYILIASYGNLYILFYRTRQLMNAR